MDFLIREIKQEELSLLDNFLYEAIFQHENTPRLPKEIIFNPEIYIYVKDFGKPDDLCLLAEIQGIVVGAVWTRILSGEIKGYGNIDNSTPEFAISICKEFRNLGIGTALMKNMLKLLHLKGYPKVSLAVQKDNYAVKMYCNLGFRIIKESDDEYLMICDLN